MFDLNCGKDPELTIAKRFGRENTNDLGENLNIGTSDIVVLELKKFFWLCAIEINSETDLQRNPSYVRQGTSIKKRFLQAPFPAPPLIERAWDLVILYTEHYEKFCEHIFGEGAWLDKPIFKSKKSEAESYFMLWQLADNKKNLLFPFWNLWPKFKSHDDYLLEKQTVNVLLSERERAESREFFKKEAEEAVKSGTPEDVLTAGNKIAISYLKQLRPGKAEVKEADKKFKVIEGF